jgi:monofunctional biosynthetic peptidoglycan transglycosylase
MLDQATMGRRTSSRTRHPWLRRTAVVAMILLGSLLFLILVFRFVNPPLTTVIVAERLEGGQPLRHRWVPLQQISGELPLAVIAAEDGRFCSHWGVDWGAVKEAIKEAKKDGEMRGASTIPMQTAKNLFLWSNRSFLRKGLEVPMAYLLTLAWPKWRVMEVYLNIVEWGPGVFGAEAASQYHFHKSAWALDRHEAALLAAALPNPRVRNPGKPGPRLTRIAHAIERRMGFMASRAACVLGQIEP